MTNCINITDKDKWIFAANGTLVYLLFSSSSAYKLTNSLGLETVNKKHKFPSVLGVIIHAVLFALIIRALMETSCTEEDCTVHSSKDRWIAALTVGILFAVLNSEIAYNLTNTLFAPLGLPTAGANSPTSFGWVLHGVLYFLIARGLMEIKQNN